MLVILKNKKQKKKQKQKEYLVLLSRERKRRWPEKDQLRRRRCRRRSWRWRWNGAAKSTLSEFVATTRLASWSGESANSLTSCPNARSFSTPNSSLPSSPTTPSCSLISLSSPLSRWPWSGVSFFNILIFLFLLFFWPKYAHQLFDHLLEPVFCFSFCVHCVSFVVVLIFCLLWASKCLILRFWFVVCRFCTPTIW